MDYSVLDNIRRSGKYFEELYPNVWLMDNHKWTFYVWEDYRFRRSVGIPPILVHMDKHWDGVNDFQTPETIADLININSAKGVMNLIEHKSLVRYDSFIAPSIIRGFVKEVHFYCLQDDTDVGLDDDLLYRYKAKQFIHKTLKSLIEHVGGRSILFDLDLDLFNRSDQWNEGDIWPEEDIVRFMGKCSELIINSPLITVAMSFDYSGTDKDTKYLAKLVIPIIIHYAQNRG